MKAAHHAARWTAGVVVATSCGCSLLVAPAASADTESGSGGAAKSPVSSVSRAASKALSKSVSQSLSGSAAQTRSAAGSALGHAGTAAGAVSNRAGQVVTRTVVITREALAAAGDVADPPAGPIAPMPADAVAPQVPPVPVVPPAAPLDVPPAQPIAVTLPLAPPGPVAVAIPALPAASTIEQPRMSAPAEPPSVRPRRGFADAVRALIGGESLEDLVRDAAPGLIALLCAVTAGMRMQSGRWLPLRR